MVRNICYVRKIDFTACEQLNITLIAGHTSTINNELRSKKTKYLK